MTKEKEEGPGAEKRKHLFFFFNWRKEIDEKVHPLLTKICVTWHSKFPCHLVLSYSK